MAYQTAPNASFVVHAGDLINSAHRDVEWAEWYKAGGFIHSQWTAIPVVGNHEFRPLEKLTPDKGFFHFRDISFHPQSALEGAEGQNTY